MAHWRFYLPRNEVPDWLSGKEEDRNSRQENAKERQLYYDSFDWVEDGHRWILRFHFSNKGKELIWIPEWDDLSRVFKAGARIEKRNSMKDYQFFETAAFKVLTNIPDTIEGCEKELAELSEEEFPFLETG